PGFHQAIFQFQNEPDAWVANNQRFVTFRIQEKPRVLILTEDRKRSEPLRGVLQFLNFDADQATLTDPLDFRKYDAVFMTGIASPNEKLWNDLAKYVGEGRGLCVIPPGEELDRQAYNTEAAQKVLPGKMVAQIAKPGGVSWHYTDFGAL